VTDAFSLDALYDLKHKGIHIVPNFFDLNEVTAIKASIDHCLDQTSTEQWQSVREGIVKENSRFGVSIGDPWRLWIDKEGSDQRISQAEFLHELIQRFAFDERLRLIGCAYLERQITLRFCMANRTKYQLANMGSGGGWHRDANYRRGYKTLIYLSDSDLDNGCFQYLERSASVSHHLLKTPVPDKYQFTNEEVMKMVDSDVHKITNAIGKAGTLVIFDTNGIHRGKPLAPDGMRYAMTNYYRD
jgi:hypothetical protein